MLLLIKMSTPADSHLVVVAEKGKLLFSKELCLCYVHSIFPIEKLNHRPVTVSNLYNTEVERLTHTYVRDQLVSQIP